jgi:hypothetical protein
MKLKSLEKWDPDRFSLEDMYSGGYVIGVEMIRSIATQLNGLVAVLDCEGFSFKHARQFNPRIIANFVDIIMVCENSPFQTIYGPCYCVTMCL